MMMMMMRSFAPIATAAILLAMTTTTTTMMISVSAYSILPQRASYFVGRDVLASATTSSATRASHAAASTSSIIEMKKGKANIPSHMRSQYARAQEMEGMRKQMMESTTVGSDGMPIFNLFVRTSLKNVSDKLFIIVISIVVLCFGIDIGYGSVGCC